MEIRYINDQDICWETTSGTVLMCTSKNRLIRALGDSVHVLKRISVDLLAAKYDT